MKHENRRDVLKSRHAASVLWATALIGVWLSLATTLPAAAAELWIGGATVEITPDRPVALDGQRNARISRKVETPLSATALALQSRDGDKAGDEAILVSCDLVAIRPGILDKVRQKVKSRLPDFDLSKLSLGATHTHTAPVTAEGRYTLPDGIMTPTEYAEFLTAKVADAVVESWQKRKPGKVGWGLGQAVVAQNRRTVYADGSAQMYGRTNRPDFRAIEGYEDHGLEVLFFWDQQEKLIATAVNIACPSQEVGGGSNINADFWHPVRQTLRERHGQDLLVLGWAGASGDHTSRLMFGTAADERMRKLRGGLTRLDEIARRIVNGWEEAYEGARKDIRSDVRLAHRVQAVELPWREVTEAEVAEARQQAAKYAADPAQRWNYLWNQAVVDRYEAQQAGTAGIFTMELHVLRLGDVAIATNEFELFTDYGVQIKARSPAVQTFIIQLTGSAGYLPSQRAVRGGGYSAVIQSNRIGPEGGQVLVERTLETIRELWKE
ncbi:MAG: hypothetical protein GX575_27435 [Candidatus Anammoximicrobium sp.]|nr:hypothetical protein [Candidatus Anammoximicrobium sp.]